MTDEFDAADAVWEDSPMTAVEEIRVGDVAWKAGGESRAGGLLVQWGPEGVFVVVGLEEALDQAYRMEKWARVTGRGKFPD